MSKELPIPEIALKSERSIELVRVWAAEGAQHVSIATQVWEDPAAWGLMLVDLARHVASAYAEQQGLDREETLLRIREGFDAEWEAPTG